MIKTLKDLALALLNATLLLIALCLFLAWLVSSRVDGMLATFASNLELVGPLREDVQAMTAEGRLDAGVLRRLEQGDGLGHVLVGRIQASVGRVGHARVERARETQSRQTSDQQTAPDTLHVDEPPRAPARGATTDDTARSLLRLPCRREVWWVRVGAGMNGDVDVRVTHVGA